MIKNDLLCNLPSSPGVSFWPKKYILWSGIILRILLVEDKQANKERQMSDKYDVQLLSMKQEGADIIVAMRNQHIM